MSAFDDEPISKAEVEELLTAWADWGRSVDKGIFGLQITNWLIAILLCILIYTVEG